MSTPPPDNFPPPPDDGPAHAPEHFPDDSPEHAWTHEHLATALAGGLTSEEQSRFDAHIHACPDCFDAFTEARDADRTLLRTLDPLIPSDDFEDRLITAFREKEMETHGYVFARRAGLAVAAAVALAATGVFAQYATHANFLNNPLSKQLAEQFGSPTLNLPGGWFSRGTRPLIESVSGNSGTVKKAKLSVGMGDGHVEFARRNDIWQDEDQSIAKRLAGKTTESSGATTNQFAAELAARQLREERASGSGGGTAHGLDVNGQPPVAATESPYAVNLRNNLADRSRALTTLSSTAYSFQRQLPGGSRTAHTDSSLDYYKPTQQRDQAQVAALSAADKQQPVNAPTPPPIPTAPSSAPTAPEPHPKAPPATTLAQIAERKIIRNGNVEFEVRSFDDAFATVSAVVREEGGFISATSSDKLANGKIRGTITVRVPPEHLDRLLLKLRALGDLKSQKIGDTDITREYTDLQSELKALRAMESRLLDIIKNGKGAIKDLVAAEKQLGEYRVRIEKIEGEIRYDDNLVAMATLTIAAYEKDIQTPTAAQEQEHISLNLETEDVETRYADALKILSDAKGGGGRILNSQLQKHDAGQFAATITAEVPPDKADFVAAQLKQLGTVTGFNRDRKQLTTGGSGTPTGTVQVEQKPTQFTLSLYNLANIAPRETAVLTIAVPSVETAFRQVITDVRRSDVKTAKPLGRIVTSTINGQQPEQMTADIHADIAADQADAVLASVRGLGEVMSSSFSENPDTANVTSAKRGLQLHIVSTASVPPRESRTLTLVAQSVPDAYGKLIASLQSLESKGNARILASQLNQSDPRTVSATLAFDIRRDSLPAVEKALADAGIDTLSRNISRSSDTANTLDSKIHFQIDQLLSADALQPRRTTTLGIDTDNVEKAIDTLRAQLQKDGLSLNTGGHMQYTISKESTGRVTAHLVVDVPVSSVMTVLNQIHDLGGTEKVNQVVEHPQVPDTRFNKERIDLTLTSRQAIVASNEGILATTRAALASAAAALLWSLYLILTGLLFLGPWLAIAWLLWRITKRRKAAT